MPARHKFWDRIAKFYSRSKISDEAAYTRKLANTQALMRPDMKVVEFGCGTGTTAIKHAPFVSNILASDISNNMLNIARGKAADAGVTNVEFRQSTLEDLKLPDASVDMVLGLSILHLLDNREETISEAMRILRPGGWFISSTACLGKGGLLRFLLPVGAKLGALPAVQFFSAEDLEQEITNAGFQITESWRPNPKAAVFLIAQKPLSAA